MAVVQYTFTHTHNTQNDTKQTIHRTTQKFGRVQAVPCLCVFYPDIFLTTEEKHGKTSVRVAEECQLVRCRYIYTQ